MVRAMVAVAVMLVVAVLLVVPFHPEAPVLHLVQAVTPATPTARAVDWFVVESGGNFLVFALVGAAAFTLLRRPLMALAIACLLSASAELAQLVIPHRVASWSDVVTNCCGAAVGVGASVLIARVRRRGGVRAAG